VQPALANWQIESRLTFTTPPHVATQQGGIIAYQDDDNCLKLDWEHSGSVAQLAETTEDSLSGSPATSGARNVADGGAARKHRLAADGQARPSLHELLLNRRPALHVAIQRQREPSKSGCSPTTVR
jgi:hypothetical protein